MSGIINGVWRNDHEVDPAQATELCNWITADGSSGATGRAGFKAEPGRYHLYLSHGCPYSHRVIIAVHYLGFANYFTTTYVDDIKRDRGWQITQEADPVFGADSLQAVMIAAEGKLTSETTVPLLVDKISRRIVSNSSADLVRMLDNLRASSDAEANVLWPPSVAPQVDQLNDWIRSSINSAVYWVLFETDPVRKKQRIEGLRVALGEMEQRLGGNNRYLHGQQISASDLWLFTTLLRFDSVYSEIFGLGFKMGAFENLSRYLRDLYSVDAFAVCSDLNRIENHYYLSLIHGPYGTEEPGLGRVADELLRFEF